MVGVVPSVGVLVLTRVSPGIMSIPFFIIGERDLSVYSLVRETHVLSVYVISSNFIISEHDHV